MLNGQYDYLIVGAGLFGAVFAHEAKAAGKKTLTIFRISILFLLLRIAFTTRAYNHHNTF